MEQDTEAEITIRLRVRGNGTPDELAGDIVTALTPDAEKNPPFTEVITEMVGSTPVGAKWREAYILSVELVEARADRPEWAEESALILTLVDDKEGKLKFYCWYSPLRQYVTGVEYNRGDRRDYGATEYHNAAVSAVRTVTHGITKAKEEGWK